MTSLRDFVIECLDDEARLLAYTADLWEREQPNRHFEFPLSNYISRHGPEATTRHFGSARDIVKRHRPATEEERRYRFGGESPCVGCGEYDATGGDTEFNTGDINNCPELRALAWRWSYHRKWEKRWCLHVTIENVNTTTLAERARDVRSYIEVCRRCGEQIGEPHEVRLITARRQP